MRIEQNDLRDRYSKMDTEKLIKLYQCGTLTDVARSVLESEISSRGISAEKAASTKFEKEHKKDIGFQWWVVWAWLSLTLGNFYTIFILRDMMILAVILITISSVLAVMILRFNKYAFLVATILTFNPLFWIINGIYLKRRWHHSKVNNT